MPTWQPIALPAPKAALAAEHRGIALPQDYYTEFDTDQEDSPIQREAFFLWLSDPIPCFVGTWRRAFASGGDVSEELGSELDGLTLEGVGSDWNVVTLLRNHHRRLNPRINMVRATVSYDEETVYVTVDKQLEDPPDEDR